MNKHHVFTPDLNQDLPVFQKSEGMYMHDQYGNTYMDCTGGPGVLSYGHGRVEFGEAITEQISKVTFVYRSIGLTDTILEVTEKLHELTGFEKFMLLGSGSEAVEVSTQLAKIYHLENGKPTKTKIITRWMSYHGSSPDCLALGGNISRRLPFENELWERNISHIAPSYCYRCWYGKEPETCNCECALSLEQEILKIGSENVAGFLMEPISGSSQSCTYAPDKYYKRIREICDKYDVLLIFDEVIVGSGRVGKYCAFQHFGIRPDIIALAKSISGGYYPVAVVGCEARVAEVCARGRATDAVGHTWTNQHMGAAVILKAIETMKKQSLLENVEKMGEYLLQRLLELKEKHTIIGDVRGKGLFAALEFVQDQVSKKPFPAEYNLAGKLCGAAAKNGLLVAPGGQEDYLLAIKNPKIKQEYDKYGIGVGNIGDRVMFAPYFMITKEELDIMIEKYDQVLTAAEAEIKANIH